MQGPWEKKDPPKNKIAERKTATICTYIRLHVEYEPDVKWYQDLGKWDHELAEVHVDLADNDSLSLKCEYLRAHADDPTRKSNDLVLLW